MEQKRMKLIDTLSLLTAVNVNFLNPTTTSILPSSSPCTAPCFTHGGSRGCPCFLLPPSLAVLALNRCQRWVKSSPEGPPAAYWFIINEIRAAVCRGGFGPSEERGCCQEHRRWDGETEEETLEGSTPSPSACLLQNVSTLRDHSEMGPHQRNVSEG